jgi:tRNA/tmRNA/rRNA uracil-C5-methylase (TrmA/RlmC/RlmD family)
MTRLFIDPLMSDEHERTLRIDALSHGRAAVARDGGKVVFVEGAAPGDVVRARLRRDHGTYAEADVEEILDAGAARVEPPCPIVDACGGCCWQHVAYADQLHAKHRAVVDAFERIAGISEPPVAAVIASPHELGYRNRLKLRFDGGRLGFYRARTHSLVPIADCLIADARIREAHGAVEAFVAALETRVTRVEIASRGAMPGLVLALNSAGRLRRSDVHRVRDFLARGDHAVRGVAMWGRGWRRDWGDIDRSETIEDGLSIETRGASFGQVNSEANRLLVATVLELARARAETSCWICMPARATSHCRSRAARAGSSPSSRTRKPSKRGARAPHDTACRTSSFTPRPSSATSRAASITLPIW